MDIKVLGTGCANCKNTIAFIHKVAQAKGVAVQLEKVGDIRAIMGYGVMSTHGLVPNEVVNRVMDGAASHMLAWSWISWPGESARGP